MPKRTTTDDIATPHDGPGAVLATETVTAVEATPSSFKPSLADIGVIGNLDETRLLKRGGGSAEGFGRSMNDLTANILQMLRANPGQWVGPCSYNAKALPPGGRLSWMGFNPDGTGPENVDAEKAARPGDYEVKHKIAYRYYAPLEDGPYAGLRPQYLQLTEETYTPPKSKDETNGQAEAKAVEAPF